MEIVVSDVEDMFYLRSVMDSYQYYPKELKIIGSPSWNSWKEIVFPKNVIEKVWIEINGEKKNVSQNLDFYLEQTKTRKLRILPNQPNSLSKHLILFIHPSQPFTLWNQIPKNIEMIHILGDSYTPLSIPYASLLPIRVQDDRQPHFYEKIIYYPSIMQRLFTTLLSHSTFSLSSISFDQISKTKNEKMWEYLNRIFQRDILELSEDRSFTPIEEKKIIFQKMEFVENRSIEEDYQILHQLKPEEKLFYYQKVIEPKLRAKPVMKTEIKREEVKKIIPKMVMEKEYILTMNEYSIFTFLWTLAQMDTQEEMPCKVFISKTKFNLMEPTNPLFIHFVKNFFFKKIEEMKIVVEWFREDLSVTVWEGKIENKENLMKWKKWMGMKEYEMEHLVFYIWMDGLKEIPTFFWENKEKVILLKHTEKNKCIEEAKECREFDILDFRFLQQYHGFVPNTYLEIANREMDMILKAKSIYGYKQAKTSFYDFVMEFR